MKKHESMRGYFAYELNRQMKDNPKIYLLTGDLGYRMFDGIREKYPQQYINCGASEQAMMDMATGMALSGKLPIVYSITPFLIYRSFETIRTYINHENLKIILVGSGRDDDYKHDGYSHNAEDIPEILYKLTNIAAFYPEDKDQIATILEACILKDGPSFISLRR